MAGASSSGKERKSSSSSGEKKIKPMSRFRTNSKSESKASFTQMAKKLKGRAVVTATTALVSSSKSKHDNKKSKGGLASAISTMSMLKKKFVEEEEEDEEGDEYDDLASEEGDEVGAEIEEEEEEQSIREITLEDIRRIKAKMKTVSQIMIEGEDVEIGSDSDVSDTSQIWDEDDYGDEIVVDRGQKLTKWGPSGRVSQRLSMKERGAKVLKEKKKAKKKDSNESKKKPKTLYSRESQAHLMLQAMASNEEPSASKEGYQFVPTGPGYGSGSGVYFIDFSDDYKRCLKLAREKLEENDNLSALEHEELQWINGLKEIRGKPLPDKLLQLKLESPRASPRSQSPRVKRRDRSGSGSSAVSEPTSEKSEANKSGEEGEQTPAAAPSADPEANQQTKPDATKKASVTIKGKTGKKGVANTKGVEYDAMGSRWNKSMWDNMENYWRMVMSHEDFEVTPGCYDRQLDSNYRYAQETVSYGLLEEARNKCLKWIAQNKDHFSL